MSIQKFIDSQLEKYIENANITELSTHSNLTLNFVKAHPEVNWHFMYMNRCKNFHPTWVLEFPDKFWDLPTISLDIKPSEYHIYAGIPDLWHSFTRFAETQFIIDHKEYPWKFDYVTGGKDDVDIAFTRIFLDRLPQSFWLTYTYVSSWETIVNNIDLPWRFWNIIFKTSDINDETIQFIMDHDYITWNYELMSMVASKTIIEKYPDFPWVDEFFKLNKDYVSVPVIDEVRIAQQWIAALRIQRFWKKTMSSPMYKLCRNRLVREFSDCII